MKTRKENTRKKAKSPTNDIVSFTSNSEARAYLETYFKEITPSDEFEIMERLKESAKEGDPMCQHMLGFCLSVGYGCEANPREAIKWWAKAAEKGKTALSLPQKRFFVKQNPMKDIIVWRECCIFANPSCSLC